MHRVESSLFLGTVLFCSFIQHMCFEHLLCARPRAGPGEAKTIHPLGDCWAHSGDSIDSGKEMGRCWSSSGRWKDSGRQWRLVLWELSSEQGRPARPVSAGGFESAAHSPGVPDGRHSCASWLGSGASLGAQVTQLDSLSIGEGLSPGVGRMARPVWCVSSCT